MSRGADIAYFAALVLVAVPLLAYLYVGLFGSFPFIELQPPQFPEDYGFETNGEPPRPCYMPSAAT